MTPYSGFVFNPEYRIALFLLMTTFPRFPEAASRTAVSLGIVTLFSVAPLVSAHIALLADIAVVIAIVVSLFRHWAMTAELGAFAAGSLTFALFGLPSQVCFAFGLAAYAAVWRLRHGKDRFPDWFTAGTFTREVTLTAAFAVVVSGVVLSIWFRWVHPDIDDIIQSFVPDWPLAALIIGGLLFSMFNAALEELAYRGIIMSALEAVFGPGAVSLATQAIAFGLLHIHGFPRGGSGIMLAFLFGVLMGWVRRRSGGLLAPWAAHVCADVVIVGLVVMFART